MVLLGGGAGAAMVREASTDPNRKTAGPRASCLAADVAGHTKQASGRERVDEVGTHRRSSPDSLGLRSWRTIS